MAKKKKKVKKKAKRMVTFGLVSILLIILIVFTLLSVFVEIYDKYQEKKDLENNTYLSEAIINQIPERQYFDVKHDKLSKKQLNDILNQLKKQKSEDDYVVGLFSPTSLTE